MPRILFLLGDVAHARNDNHLRLPAGFRRLGWEVSEQPHDSARIQAGSLRFGNADPGEFELIWPLGFGPEGSFFDRMQLLDLLDPQQLVNGPRALSFLHGKYRWLELMPETHADNDVARLREIIAQGGDWVIKPPAGSYGRDVVLVRAGEDPRVALEHLISPRPAANQPGNPGNYCIVQRFVPAVAAGETRSLVAGGEIVGSYLRIPRDGLRANLEANANIAATTLTTTQAALTSQVALELREQGARFAAIDLVEEYLLEVNVANPGGLASLEELYGRDFSTEVARCIAGPRD